MDISLSALFPGIYIFTPGRRIVAMRQVKSAAEAAGHSSLVEHADACIAHDQKVLIFDAQWSGREASGSLELRELDNTLDPIITSLRDTVERQVRASSPGDALGDLGAGLLQVLFPLGVSAVTNTTYADQSAQVERILAELKQAKWATLINEFGLARIIARISGLAVDYRKSLDTPGSSGLKFATVKAARVQGQQNMLEAMAMILGKYPSESADDRAGREALLGPILRQNDAIGQHLKARRSAPDVDPETGVETSEGKPT